MPAETSTTGARVVAEVEVAARCGGLDDGSGPDVAVQPPADKAAFFAFDTDPIPRSRRRPDSE